MLVLGGRGYFGSRVVYVLRLCDDVEVAVGSRRGEVRVDLGDPSTFAAFDDFDVVVNCADTVGASPLPAARHVLEHGGVWMDMGAEAGTAQQLLDLEVVEPKGHVVVGVGIFPGLLTMLGKHVSQLVGPCERIDLGVRLSTLSGAGKGNVRLMVEMLDQPGFDFHEGKRRERPALGPVTDLPYAGTGPAPSSAITMPDTALVRRVTTAPNVATHLAVVPSWMRPGFSMTQWLLDHSGPLRGLVLAMTRWSLLVMRAVVLRALTTRVQLTAVANRGRPDETARALDFEDGRDGNALGVAAAVLLWRDVDPPDAGVYPAASLFGLDEALVRLTHAGLAPPPIVDPAGPD